MDCPVPVGPADGAFAGDLQLLPEVRRHSEVALPVESPGGAGVHVLSSVHRQGKVGNLAKIKQNLKQSKEK